MWSRLFLVWVILLQILFGSVRVSHAHSVLPSTVALSIADDPPEQCVHVPPVLPESLRKKNVSVCFSAVEERRNHTLLKWRRMTISFEEEALSVAITLRRLPVFAAGAMFQMAGESPMSVFSLIRDLFPELFVSYFNGFGSAAGVLNNSVLFTGQINNSLFEGQIIYHNTSVRHLLQCTHNITPVTDFHLLDRCIQCRAFVPPLGHSLSSPLGWRSVKSPPCGNDSADSANAELMGRGFDPHENSSKAFEKHPDNIMALGSAENRLPLFPGQNSRMGSGVGKATKRRVLRSHHDPARLHDKRLIKSLEAVGSDSTQGSEDIKAIGGNSSQNVNNSKVSKEGSAGVADKKERKSPKETKRFPFVPVLERMERRKITKRTVNPFASNDTGIFSDTQQAEDTKGNKRSLKIEHFKTAVASDGGNDVMQTNATSAEALLNRSEADSADSAWTRRKQRRSQSPDGGNVKETVQTISCSLHLVADHLFFTDIGGSSPAKTINLMLAIVMGADALFRSTDFNGDGLSDSIGFLVKNITIIRSPAAAFYRYSRNNGNAFQYLKSFSTADFSDVCLGMAFTAIDFERGVVGLAWYASSNTEGLGKGGICAQRVRLPNEAAEFSFNTAIVTFINHGATVSTERAILTVAHEFGHCFGSSHDDDSKGCSPSLETGSYLMQRYRPSQYHPNSYLFSPCSVRQMYPVIVRKGSCLIRYFGPSCGNGVLEEGEECDCGMTASACQFNDPCCTPADAPPSGPDRPCTFRRSEGKQCSPVTFSCCSATCRYVTQAEQVVCREESDCYSKSTCDGKGPRCPPPQLKPDGWPCHGNVRTCMGGRCQDSACRRSGLHDCFCSEPAEDQCKLCCRQTSLSPCLAARAFNIVDTSGQNILLQDGDACLHYRGVCSSHVTREGSSMQLCVTDSEMQEEGFTALLRSMGQEGGPYRKLLLSTWPYILLLPIIPVVMVIVAMHLKWAPTLRCNNPRRDAAAARNACFHRLVAESIKQSERFKQAVKEISEMYDMVNANTQCHYYLPQESNLHLHNRQTTTKQHHRLLAGRAQRYLSSFLVSPNSPPQRERMRTNQDEMDLRSTNSGLPNGPACSSWCGDQQRDATDQRQHQLVESAPVKSATEQDDSPSTITTKAGSRQVSPRWLPSVLITEEERSRNNSIIAQTIEELKQKFAQQKSSALPREADTWRQLLVPSVCQAQGVRRSSVPHSKEVCHWSIKEVTTLTNLPVTASKEEHGLGLPSPQLQSSSSPDSPHVLMTSSTASRDSASVSSSQTDTEHECY